MIDEIRGCVRRVLRNKGESDAVGDTDALLTTGILDSMDVLEIITFLEERLALDLAGRPFDPSAFDTIEGMAGFCAGLRAAG
jgi:acyl carrier protein